MDVLPYKNTDYMICDDIDEDLMVISFLNPEVWFSKIKKLGPRNNLEQFRKYYDDKSVRYICLVKYNEQEVEDPRVNVVALIAFSKYDDGYLFVKSFESFEKGYGKILLQWFIKTFKKVILISNWGVKKPEDLLNYYRDPDFGFTEVLDKEHLIGTTIHWFKT